MIVLALKNEMASWVNLVNIRQQKDGIYKQSYLAGHSLLINILDLGLRQKLPPDHNMHVKGGHKSVHVPLHAC